MFAVRALEREIHFSFSVLRGVFSRMRARLDLPVSATHLQLREELRLPLLRGGRQLDRVRLPPRVPLVKLHRGLSHGENWQEENSHPHGGAFRNGLDSAVPPRAPQSQGWAVQHGDVYRWTISQKKFV